MPFREKSAWITLFCLVVASAMFFGPLAHGRHGLNGWVTFHFFIHSVLAFIVLQIVLRIISFVLTRKEDRKPVDERERLILLKAGRNAHIVLLIGVILTPLGGHLGFDAPAQMYHLMLALVISEIVRAASQIAYFRMGR